MIAAGAALVLYWYGGRQLDHLEGMDAVQQWQVVRAAFTSQAPTSRAPMPGGDLLWSGGRWVSADGQQALVLIGRC
ncbi:hypothetical protein [Kineococcus sp. SYSU DK005]|uniref:hypothetical protein n=1 Tax=Kineococcus sp. SYSU DK005 TaxID=3383126 RepID=UPI003D7F0712